MEYIILGDFAFRAYWRGMRKNEVVMRSQTGEDERNPAQFVVVKIGFPSFDRVN